MRQHFLLLRLFALVAALTFTLCADAYDFLSGGIYYSINSSTDKTVEVAPREYMVSSYSGDVTIPLTVKYVATTYTVEGIGETAFYECTGLTSITLPSSTAFTYISVAAFYGCTGLTSITIPNAVTSIGMGAFEGCTGLTSVTIPNKVKWIDAEAFYGCSKLTSVTIGSGAQSISREAFSACPRLTSVTCLAITPPEIQLTTSEGGMDTDCHAFGNYTLNNGTLKVPRGRKSAYQSADGWKDFSNIQELPYDFVLDGICYNITGTNTVEVTYNSGYNSYSGRVSIPSVVTFDGKDYRVTAIGNYAFYNCTGLTSVSLPGLLTRIGEHSFDNCTGLTSVSFPTSVTSIGRYAFYNCSGLTSLTIPGSVTQINESTFYGCSSLTSVTIPNLVTSISNSAFSYCTNLTNLTIGTAVTDISAAAFLGCNKLESVIIPNSVTSLGYQSFYGCSALLSVTIGSSVTAIGDKAFASCSRLFSIDCQSVTPPSMPASTVFDSNTYNNALLKVPKGTKSAYQSANYWSLFSTIQAKAYDFVKNNVYYYITGENTVEVTYKDDNYNSYSGTVIIPRGVIYNDKVYLVTAISDYAFADCGGLRSVTIPSAVTAIGSRAFSNCLSLSSVTIPDAVTTIGTYAFYNCQEMSNVDFGKSVTTIGSYAFYHCIGLTNVKMPESVTTIGGYAFYSCTGLTSVKIPSSVTSIGNRAFYYCDNLTLVNCRATTPPTIQTTTFSSSTYNNAKLVVSEGCVSTYQNAANWQNFTQIYASGYSFQKDGIYYKVTSYENPSTVEVTYYTTEFNTYSGDVTIPSNVEYMGITWTVTGIGQSAFEGCTGLTGVTIPSSVTSIRYRAFLDCSSLTSVEIPNSVTNIGHSAFARCSGLRNVTIGNSVTTIEQSAFMNCSALSYVHLPNSVTSLGYQAFYGCTSLGTVTIGKGVTTIGDDAFWYCPILSEVYCNATTPPTIQSNTFTDSHYRRTTLYVPGGCLNAYQTADYWKNFNEIIELKCYDFEQYGVYYNFRCEGEVEITYGDEEEYNSYSGGVGIFKTVTYEGETYRVTAIGERAFKDCGELYQVSFFEDAVTYIGDEAFKNCWSLTDMELPRTLTYIGERAFENCEAMTYVTLGNSVTRIGDFAFQGCSSLTSMTLPNSLTDLGKSAFCCCFELSSVNIPPSVSYIDDWTFAECYALTSLDIPHSVTGIGDEVFFVSGLESITLSRNLRSIGNYAFEGCSELQNVICLSPTPPVIQPTTFDDNHFTTVTLMVPKGCKSAYMAADYWKNFATIIELPGLDDALNVDGGQIHFTSEGDYPWEVAAGGGRYYAMSSNSWVHSSTSTITATVTLAQAGSVSFDFKAWGEGNSCDVCIFSVDGTQQFRYGERDNDWETYTAQLTAGTHTLTWTYRKDNIDDPVGDYFAIDNVVVTGTTVPGDVDGDGEVGIGDIADLIDMILSGTATIENCPAADVDGDGRITIGDAAEIIDSLLGN